MGTGAGGIQTGDYFYLNNVKFNLANDSTPVPPGSLRIRKEDMEAIMPNLSAGMKVYFY